MTDTTTGRPGAVPSGIRLWVAGARPRTLPASVTPVIVGTGVAVADGHPVWWRALVALVVAVALQVGCNYANDYSDGVRGTDEQRVGPLRLVGSGAARPRTVLLAACLSFAVAAVAGLVLAAVTTWWLLLVGALAIAAAWFYTGGRRPYGYAGLGEPSVFVFFGLVPVVGTAYVQTGRISTLAVLAALPLGLLIVNVLVANNLRDIPSDAAAGKRTLAVRMGDRNTRLLYAGAVAVAAVLTVVLALGRPWVLVALLAAAVAWRPARLVLTGRTGRDLVPALVASVRLVLVYGVLVAAGLVLQTLLVP